VRTTHLLAKEEERKAPFDFIFFLSTMLSFLSLFVSSFALVFFSLLCVSMKTTGMFSSVGARGWETIVGIKYFQIKTGLENEETEEKIVIVTTCF
jgi:hypothetical protein